MYDNMMRVEVAMSESFRGLVAEYSSKTGKSMPQSYKDLMDLGLAVSGVELENHRPQLDEFDIPVHTLKGVAEELEDFDSPDTDYDVKEVKRDGDKLVATIENKSEDD